MLQSMLFSGIKDNEWVFESPVRYIKVVGGPPRQEELIIGLKNGQVSYYFIKMVLQNHRK